MLSSIGDDDKTGEATPSSSSTNGTKNSIAEPPKVDEREVRRSVIESFVTSVMLEAILRAHAAAPGDIETMISPILPLYL